ncbi:MAG: C39 family peptidase [Verrucomicrobiales bacterium]|nr:C39 family peptidase [Verrucomicrobiales bacterium]
MKVSLHLRAVSPFLLAATLLPPPAPATAQSDGDEKARAFAEQIQAGQIPCALDPLAAIPAAWGLTPDQLDTAYAVPDGVNVKKNPYFEWMTQSRDRAVFMRQPFSNLRVDLTLFDNAIPVEEVVVDFIDGKLNGITFSLYNRGDAGEISSEEFQRRFKLCGQKIGEMLQIRPTARKANPTQGLLSEGWTWISQHGMAVLEHNPEANQGRPEFLRLKIAPRTAKGAIAASFQQRSTAVKQSDLPRNVTKGEGGDIYIKGIPMVDQGPKGYCVVATAQRLFEYYGIPADQHQIAQVAGSDAEQGTSSIAMVEALGKIDYRFKTRFKIIGMGSSRGLVQVDEKKLTIGKSVSTDDFLKALRTHIDQGIPLLWGLTLGEYPEIPPIAEQVSGGHMRMIIGYNDETGHLIFTDSWGAGHEMKRMTYDHAYQATHGLFAMFPTVK